MNDVGARAIEAMDFLLDAVTHIPSESWDQPSNLDGWSIRDLVGHVTGSAAKVAALVEGGEIWQKPSVPDDWKCEDPVTRLRDLAARVRAALPGADLDAIRPSPQGEVPLRRALTFPVSDLAMHSLGPLPLAGPAGRIARRPADLLPRVGGVVAGRHAAPAGRVWAGSECARGRHADYPVHVLSRALGRRLRIQMRAAIV